MYVEQIDTAENTHLQGKYHCTADFLFGWIRFHQTCKSVIIEHKQSLWIKTGKTGGRTYTDTSPVIEYSLDIVFF